MGCRGPRGWEEAETQSTCTEATRLAMLSISLCQRRSKSWGTGKMQDTKSPSWPCARSSRVRSWLLTSKETCGYPFASVTWNKYHVFRKVCFFRRTVRTRANSSGRPRGNTRRVGWVSGAAPSRKMRGPLGLRIFLMADVFIRFSLRTRLKPVTLVDGSLLCSSLSPSSCEAGHRSPIFVPWPKVAQNPSTHRPGAQDTNMLVQRDQLQPQHQRPGEPFTEQSWQPQGRQLWEAGPGVQAHKGILDLSLPVCGVPSFSASRVL